MPEDPFSAEYTRNVPASRKLCINISKTIWNSSSKLLTFGFHKQKTVFQINFNVNKIELDQL